MIKKITSEKVIEKCKQCGEFNHTWKQVYYGDRSTLKKVDKIYIAWCNNVNDYVFINM